MASIIPRGLGDGYEFEPKPFPTNHDDLESWVWYYNNDNHKDTSTLLRQLDNQCKGEPDSNPTKRPILQRLHRDMHYDQHLEPGKRRSWCVQSEKAGTSLQHWLPCNKSSNLGRRAINKHMRAISKSTRGITFSGHSSWFSHNTFEKVRSQEPNQEVSLQLIVLLTIWKEVWHWTLGFNIFDKWKCDVHEWYNGLMGKWL